MNVNLSIKKDLKKENIRENEISSSYKKYEKVLIVVPAIGDTNFMEKLRFLENNIRLLICTAPSHINFCIHITCYKLGQEPVELIKETILRAVDNNDRFLEKDIFIKNEKGYLGEFLYKYVRLENFVDIDYVFLILDDVRLTINFKFDLLLEVYLLSGLDIISPALTHDSPYNYSYMLQDKANCDKIDIVRQISTLEFYSYLMSYKAYEKYYNTFLSKNTRWMWGIDLSFYHMNFKVGIYDYLTIQHYYQTLDYKESYGDKIPKPLEEKKNLGKKFVFSDYFLIQTIEIGKNK